MNESADTMNVPRSRAWSLFGVFAFVALIAAQAYAVRNSLADENMGHLQKILYVHVPAAWITFLAFAVVLVYSILYMLYGREKDDLLAAAAAEVGATFNGLTLVLGMIWGKPTWGAWWVWDARLTSTLVLFMIFVGYLALRSFVDDPERRAQWSAAVGVFGAINVPIVYMSVRWWRTIHQIQSSPSTLDSTYVLGLRTNAIAFLLIMIYFIRRRYELARLRRATELLADAAALGGT
ncbi:MAG: cytochrome c biogenesis protein CcsA [Gemmatimonadaceae bacterium]|nr:cytochrome c biogenesis protein CcsA [Gemmatimonadaceae bacterium]